MKNSQQIFVKRWKPILEEYEKIQNKVLPRPFRFVKDLCYVHHISNKELRRYYRKWQEGKKQDKKASTLTYFMVWALSWFKQIYNFEFEKVLSDNGPEFKGSLNREHPFEMMCDQLGIKHILLNLPRFTGH